MTETLRVLVVEDSEQDAEILAFQLRRGGYDVRYERVDSAPAMLSSLAAGTFDIVFCDYVLPDFGAPAAFALLRAARPELPFIVISAAVDENGAADLLVNGADDFIAKGHYARLIPTVRRALAVAEERRARDRLELALGIHTQRDPLTGLLTRAAFLQRLREALADTPNTPLAVIRVDLLQFGRVNEAFGHDVGDGVLRDVAARLAAAVPESATPARIASDEFGFVTAPGEAALGAAGRLLAALGRPFVVGGQAVHLSASVGIAASPADGPDAVTLIRRAGAAADRAKRTAVRVAVFELSDDRAGLGIAEAEELRSAIERGELVLHYQPQVEGDPLRATGVEALVRWAHPQKGLLPPAAFLPLARESGLGPSLTRWVLEEAVTQCRAWWMAGSKVSVAVNLTMEDAQDPALSDQIGQLLTTHGLPAAALELELTEDTAITDPLAVERTVRRLSDLGPRVSIDDFGTGYATLTYLQRLPVQRLKIDRSFVQGLTSRSADAVIVRSAIELGHHLGLSVIAEGVEDVATWSLLRELGCDGAQGYSFARPMPFCDMARWLEADAGGDVAEARRSHAARFMALAEAANTLEVGAERRAERLQEIRRERHNLDLALDGAIGRGDSDTALRLASALRFYWVDQGLVAQGAEALRRALELPHAQTPSIVRAAALNALAVLYGHQEDSAHSRPLLLEASNIQRRLGDRKGQAASMNNLGMVLDALGDHDAAKEAYLDSLAMRRVTGDANGEAHTLSNLSTNAYQRGDLATSRSYAEQALATHRAVGDQYGAASVLDTLGAIALDENDVPGALASYRESIALYRDLGVTGDVTQPMAGIAIIAAETRANERALMLGGAIEALRDRYPSLPPINADHYDRAIETLKRRTKDAQRALVEGRAMSWEQAVTLALEFDLAEDDLD